ncbi:MAG: ComF family protein [Alphaproteobacteria bacterium]|nr:ComF family protein [Alphaproteobacteria bacterium]
MTLFKALLDLILPPRCLLCGSVMTEEKGLCDECIKKIDFINGPICYECGQPLTDSLSNGRKHLLCGSCLKPHKKIFKISRSACVYDEVSKKLILDFKFYDKTDLASFLAKMMYVSGKDIFSEGVDVIVPVPLHYTRLLKRKYNQSALLAKQLGKLTQTEVDCATLVKRYRTKPQVECSGEERLKNVRGAFQLKDLEKFRNKRILLIDDVLTTGSTLKECASVLKKAHPKSICSLTVARAL